MAFTSTPLQMANRRVAYYRSMGMVAKRLAEGNLAGAQYHMAFAASWFHGSREGAA